MLKMKIISFLPVFYSILVAFAFAQEISKMDDFFSRGDKFLHNYVENGLVDYQALAENNDDLKALTQFIAHANLDRTENEHRKAFWINAYNLITINSVVDKYPIESPLQDENFFNGEKHQVAGELITLDDIEKKKLMNAYEDPRIHFVLVCAAKGCPKLAGFAYKPAMLEQQMDAQTRKALNDSNFIRLNDAENRVDISEIFNWYQHDFRLNRGILNYINQYRDLPIDSTYSIGYYSYDWSLNDK